MFVLRLRKKDKRRILRPYLQHVISVASEIEEKKKEIRLFMNLENGRWKSVPLTHPATMETVVLDADVKNKILANNYLGLKEHKLFGQVEEGFQSGSNLSPAQIGELMISNRTSPTRALKSVISALQNSSNERRAIENGPGQPVDDGLLCRESVHTVREFRKLYGLFRMGSRRKEEPPLDLGSIEKHGSRHET
ncbi:AAA-ATPase [Melia azedarach]|uniref:AAA-ATPase n=1 Tax=Melia azedarach TaxID=155640 RepID=A0ACC1YTC6_MELAZ|nr:AAA-ATPase [Melia azedarach]